MKRLGLRKVATAIFNLKPVQKADKAINAVVTAPGTISNKIGLTKLASKLKVDASGKRSRKDKNQEIKDKLMMAQKNLVMQDARDIASAKAFEREQAEGLSEMGIDMNTDIADFAATRQKEEA